MDDIIITYNYSITIVNWKIIFISISELKTWITLNTSYVAKGDFAHPKRLYQPIL